MGLLDMLQNGGGGDPGGGLLAFLNSLQQGQAPSQMGPPPSDQAQYAPQPQASSPIFAPQPVTPQLNAQPSPLDNAQWPAGPVGAPLQANAQMPVPQQPPAVIPAQGAPPMAAPGAGPLVPPLQNTAPAQASGLPATTQPGFFDRLNAGLQSVGHGGSLIGALTGNLTDPTSIAKAQQNVTARELKARGLDPAVVDAALQPGNGATLSALLKQLSERGSHSQETDADGNKWDVNKQTGQRTIALAAKEDKFTHVQTGEGLGGQKTFGIFNTKTGETKPDGVSGTPGGGAPGFGSLLAQGVTYDANKSGDSYMAQFSPEVQSAAKAYINGDVMPTGNARKDSIATFAKTVAQKYGQDTGVPVTDATYGAKRKMQTDLASSGNSTMGGILSNGESSFKHLAEYTASAADQGNVSHNFPGGGALAHVQNYIGNAGGGSDTQGKVKAINDNLGKYGAESTKFYAGTGGGVEERLNALKEMNATTTSGEEAAGYAEKEKSLMLDRLNTKFQEIRNSLGEERGNAEIAKHMPDIQKNVATIDANIARLRGKAPSAATTGPNTTKGGVSWSVVK